MIKRLLSVIFFCLKTKETKIQDWNLKAKKYFYSLKIPKLARIYYWFFGSVFTSHSDSGIFLTFIKVFFLTLQLPRSVYVVGISKRSFDCFALRMTSCICNCVILRESQLSFNYIFFCLETKETKIQDWNLKAKNFFCSLKILKLARVHYWFYGSIFFVALRTVEFS